MLTSKARFDEALWQDKDRVYLVRKLISLWARTYVNQIEISVQSIYISQRKPPFTKYRRENILSE